MLSTKFSMKYNTRMGWKKKRQMKIFLLCCSPWWCDGLKSWFKTRSLQVAAEDKHSLYHLALKKFPLWLLISKLPWKVLYHPQLLPKVLLLWKFQGFSTRTPSNWRLSSDSKAKLTISSARQSSLFDVGKENCFSQTAAFKISFAFFVFLAFYLDQSKEGGGLETSNAYLVMKIG